MQISTDSPAQVADTGSHVIIWQKVWHLGLGLDRVAIVDVIVYSGCMVLMCSLIFPGWISHQGTVFCEVIYF